jgi:hypothetical protein
MIAANRSQRDYQRHCFAALLEQVSYFRDPAHERPRLSELMRAFEGAFGLSGFELDVILLLMSQSVMPEPARQITRGAGRYSSDDHRDAQPAPYTLASFTFDDPEFDDAGRLNILQFESPLRTWDLVRFTTTDAHRPLKERTLELDDWVLSVFLGAANPGATLGPFLKRFTMPERLELSQAQQHIINTALPMLQHQSRDGTAGVIQAGVIQLHGRQLEGQHFTAAGFAQAIQAPLFVLDAALLSRVTQGSNLTVADLAMHWNRYARLFQGVLLLDIGLLSVGETAMSNPTLQAAVSFVQHLETSVIVSTRTALPWARACLSFEVQNPTLDEQRRLWADALQPGFDAILHHQGSVSDEMVLESDSTQSAESLVNAFYFDHPQIRQVTREGISKFKQRQDWQHLEFDQAQTVLLEELQGAARALTQPKFMGLAELIEPARNTGWHKLILQDEEKEILQMMVLHIKERTRVYEGQGWFGDSSKGFGIAALFTGPSGTGKTMAAEIIAKELGLDLQRVNLASLVSKFIGETEKNLAKVFDAAEAGGCVLFFDECEAIFGQRMEAQSSNDKYANLEVTYLLQRMESFRGLVILATNYGNQLDTAFKRRIRFTVQFREPTKAERLQIWQTIFPAQARVQGLNYELLANFEASGGTIRKVALNASFIASSEGSPITMRHLYLAAKAEMKGKIFAVSQLNGWDE